jgi:hypothetical protein
MVRATVNTAAEADMGTAVRAEVVGVLGAAAVRAAEVAAEPVRGMAAGRSLAVMDLWAVAAMGCREVAALGTVVACREDWAAERVEAPEADLQVAAMATRVAMERAAEKTHLLREARGTVEVRDRMEAVGMFRVQGRHRMTVLECREWGQSADRTRHLSQSRVQALELTAGILDPVDMRARRQE